MHVRNDPDELEFALWQRRLANGELNDADDNMLIPPSFLCTPNDVHCLIRHTYPDIALPHGTEYFRDRCILAPRNRKAHEINSILLDMFPGDAYDLWSIDEAFDPDDLSSPDIS
jgi:hypothetical protein